MAIKSICYRKDTGEAVAVRPTDHVWSSIEQGLSPSHTGIMFAVVNMDITEAQEGATANPKTPHDPCVMCHELKVDDVDNPTSLVEI